MILVHELSGLNDGLSAPAATRLASPPNSGADLRHERRPFMYFMDDLGELFVLKVLDEGHQSHNIGLSKPKIISKGSSGTDVAEPFSLGEVNWQINQNPL